MGSSIGSLCQKSSEYHLRDDNTSSTKNVLHEDNKETVRLQWELDQAHRLIKQLEDAAGKSNEQNLQNENTINKLNENLDAAKRQNDEITTQLEVLQQQQEQQQVSVSAISNATESAAPISEEAVLFASAPRPLGRVDTGTVSYGDVYGSTSTVGFNESDLQPDASSGNSGLEAELRNAQNGLSAAIAEKDDLLTKYEETMQKLAAANKQNSELLEENRGLVLKANALSISTTGIAGAPSIGQQGLVESSSALPGIARDGSDSTISASSPRPLGRETTAAFSYGEVFGSKSTVGFAERDVIKENDQAVKQDSVNTAELLILKKELAEANEQKHALLEENRKLVLKITELKGHSIVCPEEPNSGALSPLTPQSSIAASSPLPPLFRTETPLVKFGDIYDPKSTTEFNEADLHYDAVAGNPVDDMSLASKTSSVRYGEVYSAHSSVRYSARDLQYDAVAGHAYDGNTPIVPQRETSAVDYDDVYAARNLSLRIGGSNAMAANVEYAGNEPS